MQAKKKNVFIAIVEQLLPLVLAVVCILLMTINTNQSILPVPRKLNFEGEYSFDGGKTWNTLSSSSDLSTNNGDLILRGHFDYDLSQTAALYIYRDHFGIVSKVNGERNYLSIQSQLLSMGEAGKKYFPDTCGKEWLVIKFQNGLSTNDTIEIHLQKMHDFIDADAYKNFLNSCYTGPAETMIIESYLQSHANYWLLLGCLFIVIAIMLLGATATSAVLRASTTQGLSTLGFLMLFSGGYLILDTITISFHSELLVFNTYARQICLMLAVYWLGLDVRNMLTGKYRKTASIVMYLSFVLNVILILPSVWGAWAIYDTLPVWIIGQIIFSLALAGSLSGELIRGTQTNRLYLYSRILLLITLLMDIAGVGNSMYSHGTCTKIAFSLVFVVSGFQALKHILIDYQYAIKAKKLEKELEESRIAIMLSQMQPHFVHNILNVIYFMCGKDSVAAQGAISKFSDYLRNNIEALSQKDLITFRKELDHIHTYLELEQIRFGEELSIIFDIEEDSFLLPVLSIQPLVENAVKHGIAKKRGGGTVTISSRQTESSYQITIVDTGVGFDVDKYIDDETIHVGIMNVRQRLSSIINATVDIISEVDRGTTVTVTIPKGKVH